MIAEDIMTKDPVSVTETVSIGEALNVLSDEGIRHLPVVRGDEVIGILSDRDFASLGLSLVSDVKGFDQLKARMSQPVTVLMSGGVVTVGCETDVTEVVDLMVDERLSALPVVETGTRRLAGILSYVDVLRALRPALDEM